MLELIAVSSFSSLLFIFFQIFKFLAGKQNSILRLRKYTSIEEIREEKRKSAKKDYKAGLEILSRGVGNAKFMSGFKKVIQQRLGRAHILLKSEEFITLCLLIAAASGLLVFIITQNILFGILAAAAGWLLPNMILKSKIKKRIKQLNEQLGDAIVLISNSLKAGYSFFQAIDIVAKEMNGPVAEEFITLQKEINLGTPTEKALESLVERVCSDDLELVVTAVLIQRQVGGNLAEILDNISTTIRERVKLKGEIKTITAQGRMSGLIISVLPVALGFILYLINPEHIGLLFKDPIGIAILIYSVVMEMIGILFINKIVKIEM